MKKFFRNIAVLGLLFGLACGNINAQDSEKENPWSFGIAPGIFVPADKDFDDSAVFSIGGFVHYKLKKDRLLELEAHYSNLDVDAQKLPAFGTQGAALDTDSNHWSIGVNHIWYLGDEEEREIHTQGWFVGAGLHWDYWDLPGTFIAGNDDDTDGIGGKILVGYHFNNEWAVRMDYLFGSNGNAKAVGGDDFERGAFEFQVNYEFK